MSNNINNDDDDSFLSCICLHYISHWQVSARIIQTLYNPICSFSLKITGIFDFIVYQNIKWTLYSKMPWTKKFYILQETVVLSKKCSLRSKRFRGVGEQRKSEERDFFRFARAKNGARTKIRAGKIPQKSLSSDFLCSWTPRKRLQRRLLKVCLIFPTFRCNLLCILLSIATSD